MTAPLATWLFVSYGGGHVKALLPVARRVAQLGLAKPVYLGLTTAAPLVREAGLASIGFRDFMREGDTEAKAHGERLADALQVQATDREESVAYLGLSYRDMEERLGVERAAVEYAQFGRQAFDPRSVLHRVFDELQPQLVVATNSPRAERAAIEVARERGIPSACLVDLFGLWERDVLARNDYADAVCVLNEGVRQSIVDAGRDASQVHVTGNPAFDAVNEPAVIEEGRKLRHAAGWDGLHVLLYASSPEPREIPGVAGQGDPAWPRRIESELIEAVQRHPQLALWVRRHPSEAPPVEVDALQHPRIRTAASPVPLHAAIHASDEVIVTVSTVGVEASLAGKRVTQVRGSILDDLSPLAAMGFAQRALGIDELGPVYTSTRPASQGANLPRTESGQAAARVVDVLKTLAGMRHG